MEIDASLFARLRTSLTDTSDGSVRFGRASFGSACFTGRQNFARITFTDFASFSRATFTENVDLSGAEFEGTVKFTETRFDGQALFEGAVFNGKADFTGADFRSAAVFRLCRFASSLRFADATFSRHAYFSNATFDHEVTFDRSHIHGSLFVDSAEFADEVEFTRMTIGEATLAKSGFARGVRFDRSNVHGNLSFGGATFQNHIHLGPLACGGEINFSYCSFLSTSLIDAMAKHIECLHAKFEGALTLRIRYATLALDHAALMQPSTVTSNVADVPRPPGTELAGEGDPTAVSITSLDGVDASMLLLSSVDLAACKFSGSHHLDQLRLEGRWRLSVPPSGFRLRRGVPQRWTKRQVITEERQWRRWNLQTDFSSQPSTSAIPDFPDLIPGPAVIATTYRQLRKSREDAKDEPGAADFYYGEMEMRRHSKGWRTAERWLLQLYWLLSGYGLRASRALGWLALAMMTTILLLMGFGLPQDSPKQEATGTVLPGGGKVTFEIDKQNPQNPTQDRFTTKRFEEALSVTLNSVVFRSSGQDLTTAGGYVEMVSRFSEPVLLGLAALAIRGRVKR
ncbi:pentapeptide repeat-containing protein [Streptomyces sp. NPDC050428]|uniref:pentapeptide repeat-containing protein n=1 Tax=unclassified Streptomyces TaxID=2593676 RepID=UPI003439D180|nr:pentapeptide repeat-containing protein [Streptomyces sp. NBC_00838]